MGYTPIIGLGGDRNSYDHLFLWTHPTGDSNPADGLVFDGGPAGDCSKLQCGNVTAWSSETRHYNELTNPAAVDFFTTQLRPSDNVYAGQVLGQLILDEIGIDTSSGRPYNAFIGPNSNSVVYDGAEERRNECPHFYGQPALPGRRGNYQVNGPTQLFTGWGQNLLP